MADCCWQWRRKYTTTILGLRKMDWILLRGQRPQCTSQLTFGCSTTYSTLKITKREDGSSKLAKDMVFLSWFNAIWAVLYIFSSWWNPHLVTFHFWFDDGRPGSTWLKSSSMYCICKCSSYKHRCNIYFPQTWTSLFRCKILRQFELIHITIRHHHMSSSSILPFNKHLRLLIVLSLLCAFILHFCIFPSVFDSYLVSDFPRIWISFHLQVKMMIRPPCSQAKKKS